jgi:sugar porter (SP) family MFS transporter
MRQNLYLLFVCGTAALGGLLFGFDTAVISGANLYIQPYFNLSDWEFGFVVSSMLLGCAAGALLAGIPSDRFGRKTVLMATAILFTVSAVGSALAESTTGFVFYRLVGGLAVGSASMLAPVYISEIAPAGVRGKMVSLNQLTIVLGISVAFFSNYYLSHLPETVSWRWMLGVEAVPASLFLFLLFTVPESPRWLVMKGRDDKASRLISRINGQEESAGILKEIKTSLRDHQVGLKLSGIFKRPYASIIWMGIILAVLQQVTGINIIMYYAPNIFKSIGLSNESAIFQSITIGGVMTAFTILAMMLVDKIGRKPLIIWGSMGMLIFLVTLSMLFFLDKADGFLVLICILGYISFFSFSLGPVVWVLIGELFPNRIRSSGVAIATFFLWMANYLVTLTFPVLLNAFHDERRGFTFLIYAVFCVMMLVYTAVRVPETKGQALEQIESGLLGNKNMDD